MVKKTPQRTPRPRSATTTTGVRLDRRRKIVTAAVQCFVKTGVAQTKMAEIAAAAGVDQPLISYYFPNLESLHEAVIIDVLRVLREASVRPIETNSNDVIKALGEYIRAPFDFAQKQAGLFSIWMYFYYMASHSDKFIELNSQIRDTGRNRIAVMIYTGIEKGVFRISKSMTVNSLALVIQGLITGNTIMMGTEKGENFEHYIELTIKATLELLGVSEKD